ncbi:beta-lactamase domain protein [Lactococcus cremoris]|uniref:Beta-lactamase domain protein n=1 Tax=Lactococcus lactis subsp. cremoris TaxID=1359 RepID=A0A161U2X1_LACLC|nr:MBL fold metallo-hydrolase [Lactococcus cremoris]KZK08434.1 beta-lactamase domain protein [Lactococcus cremoris]
MEEIFEGIYRITYPIDIAGVPDVNSYFIKDEKLLIDAGPGYNSAYQKLINSLKSIDTEIKDIEAVIVTHHHIDHIGMIKFFPPEIKIISDKFITFYNSEDYVKEVKLFVKSITLPSDFIEEIEKMLLIEALDINLENRTVIDYCRFSKENFKVIVSKGHSSKDGIIIYREKYLFSGDIIIPKIFFNCLIDFDSSSGLCTDIRINYESELTLIKNLSFLYLLPGHCQVIDKEETLRHIKITLSRMVRTERRVKKAMESNLIFIDLISKIFGEFMRYNKFLPFSDVFTILEKLNTVDSTANDSK